MKNVFLLEKFFRICIYGIRILTYDKNVFRGTNESIVDRVRVTCIVMSEKSTFLAKFIDDSLQNV